MEHPIFQACEKGNFDKLVQYMHEYNYSILDLNDAFILACRYGHLNLCKYLLQYNGNIKISAKEDEAFCSACENGHFEIAIWLLRLKPNINIMAQNNRPFKLSQHNEHNDIATWLIRLQPEIVEFL